MALCAAAKVRGTDSAPDFNREVRPILANHCFKCHGPDDKQRMAGLRLDIPEAAAAALKSGRRAVVPGRPESSELVRRIAASGALQMPPAHANKPLSEAQKSILRRWIASGADYELHWAFVPPKRPAVPAIEPSRVEKGNPIDRFVRARLAKEGLKPSPEADRYTLIRRLSLDLIGLPPTPDEADAFVADRRPDAYERVVDRLLASPHYGERWARKWLDLARYADTNGFEKDRPRSIWPYRDWVIEALNADMPFDRFTIEQLAGDMLPNPTPQQRIATGFHRNTMLNEEGGIDPLEYRFYSVVDRTATTGATWLGLTVGCAQCHTHKFDPITHRDYYQMFAFLNNADEPEMEVEKPEIAARRREIETRAAQLDSGLIDRFPPAGEYRWITPRLVAAAADGGAKAEVQGDGSILITGPNPESNSYTVVLEADSRHVSAVRVEALTHPALGGRGPGRTPHGNFVLSELTAAVSPLDGAEAPTPVKLGAATADFAQDGFPVSSAVDGDPKTGWAIHGPGQWNVDRAATFSVHDPNLKAGGVRWTFKLDQRHGSQHTLGRFRILLGEKVDDSRPLEVRRKEHFEQRFGEWLKKAEASAVKWTPLRPTNARANVPLLTILDDGSVFASGDQTKRDVYDLRFKTEIGGITAIRLESLTDARLPKRGPGRTYYEGGAGGFFLSEITAAAAGSPVKIARASQSFGTPAGGATDGDPQTGWSIGGGEGRSHSAVFNLAQPLNAPELDLRLLFERYYSAPLGRFRVSVTSDNRTAEAGLPPAVESILVTADPARTEEQRAILRHHFASAAPELSAAREEIANLRRQKPAYPTTLVFAERPPENPRPTFIHHRGEFLQPADKVQPAVLSFLNPLPAGASPNRLSFAKWLVDRRHPLTARVTVNRQWAAFFGRGLVRTVEDFGYQGESPSHPELLDWLAVEFMDGVMEYGSNGVMSRADGPALQQSTTPRPWSLKRLHKLIVMSATYRQSSRVTPELLRRDPLNKLLARGPRVRLEAEMVRDSVLSISGLLSRKIGGPSVFPPQEPGITTQGVYGPLEWKVSQGEDRYRRGLYTFAKRTAPYASFLTFDGISGEACVARREVSNTPLQALNLLNNEVHIEAAQALGRLIAARNEPAETKAAYLFRRCLTRPPTPGELMKLAAFYHSQKKRLEAKELNSETIAGKGEGDVIDRAAWTATARAVLNLDESITRP